MADPVDMAVVDAGIDESLKKLTPERMEQVVRRVLGPEDDPGESGR